MLPSLFFTERGAAYFINGMFMRQSYQNNDTVVNSSIQFKKNQRQIKVISQQAHANHTKILVSLNPVNFSAKMIRNAHTIVKV